MHCILVRKGAEEEMHRASPQNQLRESERQSERVAQRQGRMRTGQEPTFLMMAVP